MRETIDVRRMCLFAARALNNVQTNVRIMLISVHGMTVDCMTNNIRAAYTERSRL